MIRRASRYLDRHPLLAITLGFFVAVVLLTIAHDWDEAESTALRLQMLSATTRGTT